jgi:hypothetical protein
MQEPPLSNEDPDCLWQIKVHEGSDDDPKWIVQMRRFYPGGGVLRVWDADATDHPIHFERLKLRQDPAEPEAYMGDRDLWQGKALNVIHIYNSELLKNRGLYGTKRGRKWLRKKAGDVAAVAMIGKAKGRKRLKEGLTEWASSYDSPEAST